MKNSKHFIKASILLIGLIGLVLFISNLTQLTKTRFGQFWQTTEGIIVSSSAKKGRLTNRFHASYELQFKVNGQMIEVADRDYSEFPPVSYEDVLQRIKNFPPETKVLVHYDPKCPSLPNSAYFDRPGGPVIADISNMWRTIVGLALMSLAFILGLFTEMRQTLLIFGIQVFRLITILGIIFCFGLLECRYPSMITIIALLVSIPLSVVLAIFLFRPCLKAISQIAPK